MLRGKVEKGIYMSELIKFEVKPFSASRVIGKYAIVSMNEGEYNPVPDMWERMKQDGSLDYLINHPDKATVEADTIGWMGEYNPESNSFAYIAGVLVKPGITVPDGYVFRDLPACNMGIGWIQGSVENGDVFSSAHIHTAKAMEESGYEYDYSAGGFELEYYSWSRFVVPAESGQNIVIMDYYSPCKQKQSKT